MKRLIWSLAILSLVSIFVFLATISEYLFNVVFNLCLLIPMLHMTILQARELTRINDRLQTQRIAWFAVFLIGTVSLCPIIVSQYLRLMGEPSDFLILLSTYLSPIQRGTIIGLAYYVYRSKIKEL